MQIASLLKEKCRSCLPLTGLTRLTGLGCALTCAAAQADSALAPADNAVFTDEFKGRSVSSADVPTAPTPYRRPADWKPTAPYPKTLPEIARDHAAETMARAQAQMEKVNAVNRAGKYAATGAGMDRHACPEWFVDAKLGMFVDWGLWSLAAYSPYVKGARLYPDWYEYKCRPEYTKADSAAAYHRKNWGADFKPDHFIGLFRGERFDAAKMMKVFRRCGAKYVVPFLKHHSGFCLWDDPYTFRDSVDSPAKRDFAREMADAARAEGLKFGVYNSQADEWEYPILQDDGSIKMKVWGGKVADYTPDMEGKASGKIAVRDFVYDYIVPQMTAFIDRYDPDILWYDADWSTRATENGSFDITAYFYNQAEGRKEVCCNDRYGRLDPSEEAAFARKGIKLIGCRTVRGDFFTDEWGDTAENIDPKTWHPWESCSGISKAYGNHWMEELDPSMVMTDREFICHFTSIVARGGNLLLLVNLDGQGAIPKVQEARMLSIGRWLEANGEAIYATRIVAPFSTPTVDYTRSKDGKAIYAIAKEPAAEVALACALPTNARVTVLGESAALPVRREGSQTVVRLPPRFAHAPLPFVLKIVEESRPASASRAHAVEGAATLNTCAEETCSVS